MNGDEKQKKSALFLLKVVCLLLHIPLHSGSLISALEKA